MHMKTKYKIARYEELNADGSRVWQAAVNGPLRRNGEETKCRWLTDIAARFALVDQWGYVHQWS